MSELNEKKMFIYTVQYNVSGSGHSGYCSDADNRERVGKVELRIYHYLDPSKITKKDFRIDIGGCPPYGSGCCKGRNGYAFKCVSFELTNDTDYEIEINCDGYDSHGWRDIASSVDWHRDIDSDSD